MAASDHSQFKFAAERYLLDELPEQERLAYEEHFFGCESCAREVEDLITVRDGAIAVLPHMDREPQKAKSWFSQWWVPQFALGVLAVLALFSGYQNAVVIPQLKAELDRPFEILSAPQIVSSTRAGGTLMFSTADRFEPLVIATDWPENYERYRATVSRHSTANLLWSDEGIAKNNELTIALRPNRLGPGSYDLKIFGIRSGTDMQVVARSFSIQEKNGR